MSLFKNYLFPELGDKPIDAINPDELLKIINKLSETGKDKADRALKSCVSIYIYGIKEKICKINVALETKKLRNQSLSNLTHNG